MSPAGSDFSSRLVAHHWQRLTPVSAVLAPLSWLFRAVVACRRGLYRAQVFRVHRLPVPVIVVGNITVGGTGKTPLVLWLVERLQAAGWRPGVVSRGYGASARDARAVPPGGDTALFGDEPVLVAQRAGVPVWVGVDRVAAARALLAANRGINVIVSDDGLQHYRLGREIEVVVVDGVRGFGNGLTLPAGPLREPCTRLRSTDACVINGEGLEALSYAPRAYRMHFAPRGFYRLLDPSQRVAADAFAGLRLHAVAGIGHPQRFFDQLTAMGLSFEPHAFPDHHQYTVADLAFEEADAILMTEKDAVKCAPFASPQFWALHVDAVPDAALGEQVLQQLESFAP